jgi:hypothetical protein
MTALLLLEHVNLAVPERGAARRFYVDGLGCAPNPQGSNERQLHVNLGLWCVVPRCRRDARTPARCARASELRY